MIKECFKVPHSQSTFTTAENMLRVREENSGKSMNIIDNLFFFIHRSQLIMKCIKKASKTQSIFTTVKKYVFTVGYCVERNTLLHGL